MGGFRPYDPNSAPSFTVDEGTINITNENWPSALPTPIGNVITLEDGVNYKFDGDVDFSPNVFLIPNGAAVLISGDSAIQDSLITNAAGSLFTGTDIYLTVKGVNISADNAKIFDITEVSHAELIVFEVNITKYDTLGDLDGLTLTWFDKCYMSEQGTPSTRGLLFSGIHKIFFFNNCQSDSFTNTFIDLGAAAFQEIGMLNIHIDVDRTDPTQIILSGLPNSGNLDPARDGFGSVTLLRPRALDGTEPLIHPTLSGIDVGDHRWWFQNSATYPDSRAFIAIESEGSTSQTVLSDGVWARIVTDSPVESADTQRYFRNAGGDLEYSGLAITDHQFTITISVTKVGGSVGNYEFAVFVNANANATVGDKISITIPVELKNTAQVVSFSTSHPMETGDFVGIYIRPVGTSDNVTITTLGSQIIG